MRIKNNDEDKSITLELNSQWGLPNGVEWDIYCWYPDHVKFKPSGNNGFGPKEPMILRPFSAVLLEIIPKGHKPALHIDKWQEGLIPVRFSEYSQEIEIKSQIDEGEKEKEFTIKGTLPSFTGKGWLAVITEFIRDGKPLSSRRNEPLSMKGSIDGQPADFATALKNPHNMAPWQTYRLQVDEASSGDKFQLSCRIASDKDIKLVTRPYFLPLNSF